MIHFNSAFEFPIRGLIDWSNQRRRGKRLSRLHNRPISVDVCNAGPEGGQSYDQEHSLQRDLAFWSAAAVD